MSRWCYRCKNKKLKRSEKGLCGDCQLVFYTKVKNQDKNNMITNQETPVDAPEGEEPTTDTEETTEETTE